MKCKVLVNISLKSTLILFVLWCGLCCCVVCRWIVFWWNVLLLSLGFTSALQMGGSIFLKNLDIHLPDAITWKISTYIFTTVKTWNLKFKYFVITRVFVKVCHVFLPVRFYNQYFIWIFLFLMLFNAREMAGWLWTILWEEFEQSFK